MQSCLLTACHTRVTSSSVYISLCKYEIDNFEAKLLLLFYGNLQIEFFEKVETIFSESYPSIKSSCHEIPFNEEDCREIYRHRLLLTYYD